MGNACCSEEDANISIKEKVDEKASKQLNKLRNIDKKFYQITSMNSKELNNEEKNNKINLYNKHINIKKKVMK